jgi:glycosyltransferase involved in cell wall biosynthesis
MSANELIVNGQNGLIFSAGNSTELADRLRELILDKAFRERLGQKACEDSKSLSPALIVGNLFSFLSDKGLEEGLKKNYSKKINGF